MKLGLVGLLLLILSGCAGTQAASAPEAAANAVAPQAVTPPTYPSGDSLLVRENIRVVYGVGADNVRQGVGEGLFFVKRLIGNYDGAGITQEKRAVVVVLYNASAYWLLNDEAWTRLKPEGKLAGEKNPSAELVRELIAAGVHVEVCGTTLKMKGWTEADLLPGVKVVPGAYARIVDLQHLGFAYVGFD